MSAVAWDAVAQTLDQLRSAFRTQRLSHNLVQLLVLQLEQQITQVPLTDLPCQSFLMTLDALRVAVRIRAQTPLLFEVLDLAHAYAVKRHTRQCRPAVEGH